MLKNIKRTFCLFPMLLLWGACDSIQSTTIATSPVASPIALLPSPSPTNILIPAIPPPTVTISSATPMPQQPTVVPTLATGTNGEIESMTLITRTASSEYYAITYWSDGLRINGFLGRPRGDGVYPALIYNHGGYQGIGTLEGWEIVPAVEAGYVAIASQYRGNGGSQGQDGFGGADIDDVLNLLPLLKRLPYVNPERIGMLGHSRGGMMAYLALKQDTLAGTHNIKAAVAIGGVADLLALCKEHPMFISMVGVQPEDDPALYETRSATNWPELINAPLLIEHGEADQWVSIDQARRLAELLKEAGKIVEIVTYPGEDHELSRHYGGWPDALRWFQQYLGNPGEDHSFESHGDAMLEVITWFKTSYRGQ